jgi:hypothetical protein
MNPLAQVAHAKSRLSAHGEYVPTPREFERILREVGCSHSVSKRIVSKMFEDDEPREEGGVYSITGSMARDEPDEAEQMRRAAKALEERLLVASMYRLG